MEKMIQEFCAENFTQIPQALHAGATRIELCDNLAVGGTTPSLGVIAESFAYTTEKKIPLMVMIRPRSGDFVYNDLELKMMERDILEVQKIGVDGVVLGCLTKEHLLDKEALLDLLGQAEGMQVTFHMAFDLIPTECQLPALTWLADHGVTRVLTHGGPLTVPIEKQYPHLQRLIANADQRITFIIGGGITSKNKQHVWAALGNVELHGTKIVDLPASTSEA